MLGLRCIGYCLNIRIAIGYQGCVGQFGSTMIPVACPVLILLSTMG